MIVKFFRPFLSFFLFFFFFKIVASFGSRNRDYDKWSTVADKSISTIKRHLRM